MTVITLSRQMGSGGTEVATEVAQRLGLQYIDRQIIFQAARQMAAPHAALAEVDELGILPSMVSAKERKAFTATVEKLIHDFAQGGNAVIVGRGGQVVLKDWRGVLRLQIVAPMEYRVDYLMRRQNLDRQAALERLAASDKTRASYLKRNYHVDWLDSRLYDLVINTGKIPHEVAVALIVEAVRDLSGKQ